MTELNEIEIAISSKKYQNETQQFVIQKDSLQQIKSRVKKAIIELESPERLKDKLKSGLNYYIKQVSLSKKISEESEDQMQKILIVLSKTESINASLKKWPRQIEIISELSVRTIGNIHSFVLKEIAQAGVPLKEALMTANEQMPRYMESNLHAQGGALQQVMHADEVEMKIPSPVPVFSNLEQRIVSFELSVKETLEEISLDIENAKKKSYKLKEITDSSLCVIMQATEIFKDSTDPLELAINTYSADLKNILDAIDESEQILDQINFVDMKTRIESCSPVKQER